MYLLDTNVVSELRKPRPFKAVVDWLERTPDDELRIPAIVIGEIQVGIEKVRPHDSLRADAFDRWLDHLLRGYEIVPMDARLFRDWARLMDRKQPHLMADAMIAATARHLGLTVVTRNVRDFEPFGVPTLNPFEVG